LKTSPVHARVRRSRRLLGAAREDVVEHDDAAPLGVALHVGEVAHDELGEVHAVDERERDRLARERGERVVAVEVLVARLAEQRDVVAQLDLQLERRVDPDRRAAGEREAVAVPDPDLQVARRREPLVQRREELEVVHAPETSLAPDERARRMPLRRGPVRGDRAAARPRALLRGRRSRRAPPGPAARTLTPRVNAGRHSE
jgi:hypothetical protein